MKIRDLPIARKLGLLLAFNTALAVLAIALVFTIGTGISRYQDAQDQLLAMAEVMGENSRAALAFSDRQGAAVVLQSLRAKQEISAATVSGASGIAFAQVDFSARHAHVDGALESVVNALFPATLSVSHEIVDGGSVIGRIDLTAHLYHAWVDLLRSLVFMAVIGVGLSALAAYFGLRLRSFVIDPLLSLASVSHRVSESQDYSLRATKLGKDEVGALVDDFNHMLSEIQARDEALREERASLEQRVEQRTADLKLAMEEATRANRVKSEFLSTVSHELRTPLTAIAGSIGLLAGGALGALPEQVLRLLQIAQKNGQRLAFLINDLLDVEKLMAGKLHFDMQPQALMPLLDQALTDNQAYAEQFGVRLVQTHRLEGVQIEVDAQRLQQVLANLLSNAAKFSPEGGQVELGVQRLGNLVRVEVTDHGPGIADAFRARIFEKFSQADATDTRQKGGTGLGLAITRELVERMGGCIGFESEEGRGACFYFELPVWRDTLYDSVPSPLVPLSADAPRVLLVEDDPDAARMLSRMLGRVGYRVDHAVDGAQALVSARRSDCAAVVMELKPSDGARDMTGAELIRQLRRQPETARLPLVVLSSRIEQGREALGGDIAGIEWLSKPFDQVRLASMLDSVMASHHPRHLRVLHVEDDAQQHQMVLNMADGRFDFELATTLREARARVALERFDVVVLDLTLPDASGWDLLPDIRAQQPDARVVVLTGGDLTVDDTRRVDAVLQKTRVSPRELVEAISARLPRASRQGDAS